MKEIKNTYLGISLAKKELHWQPETELEEGIKGFFNYAQKTKLWMII